MVVLFVFTFDDSLFPRYALDRARTAVSQTNAVSQEYRDTHNQPTGDTKKEPSIEPLDRQTTVNDGGVDFLPRNYWHVLAPVHYFKEDKTTCWQYFRRPFHLFAFPNILIVCVYLSVNCKLTAIQAGLIYAFANTAGIVNPNYMT